MRGLAKITIACVLAMSLGLHWTLLQTVAWTGMVISYSQGAPLRVALAKTFDGKHPCALCKAIQKGRTEQRKRDHQQLTPTMKLDGAVVWQGTHFIFTAGGEATRSSNLSFSARPEAPPKPRPRLA